MFASHEAIAPTENPIRPLHRDLLVHSTKDARHRGAYKTSTNHVSGFDAEGKEIGVVFETATPPPQPANTKLCGSIPSETRPISAYAFSRMSR